MANMKPRHAAALAIVLIVVAVAVVIALAGCGVNAQGQPYKRDSIPPHKAVIYVYQMDYSLLKILTGFDESARVAINCGVGRTASSRPEDYSVRLDGGGY